MAQVFYEDLWKELADAIRNVPDASIHVNLVQGHFSPGLPLQIWEQFPDAVLTCTPNRGFDIGPFVHQLHDLDLGQLDYVCKIHTKRGSIPHLYPDGQYWRQQLLDAVLGSPQRVRDVLQIFENVPDVGVIGHSGFINRSVMGDNAANYQALCNLMGIRNECRGLEFVAGTIFWVRSEVLKPLQQLDFRPADFEVSSLPDSQLAHAVERIFGALAASLGYRTVGV